MAKSAKKKTASKSAKSTKSAAKRPPPRKLQEEEQWAQAERGVHGAGNAKRRALRGVGAKPLPRTELTKKLWVYIKKNDLQDPKNRRMIKADAALRPIFGGKTQVSMFDMTKLVNKHVKA